MPSFVNATELYLAMYSDIVHSDLRRTASDGAQTNETMEAPPGRTYVFRGVHHNIVAARPIDLRWAAASTLHFFADTEEADMLIEFRGAEKFLSRESITDTDDATCECGYSKADHGDRIMWRGAYGAHAMPQIRRCIDRLSKDHSSRRAVVTMANLDSEDINRPHCWTSLHFLICRDGLHLLVYQRSLNLAIVPYDLVNLTNILNYVATRVDVTPAELHWTVGSLHCLSTEKPDGVHRQRNETMLYPVELLADPAKCLSTIRG